MIFHPISASACIFFTPLALPAELQISLDQEKRDKLKTNIDASVWGAFIGGEERNTKGSKVLKFYLGGRLKGEVPNIINVETDKTDIILATRIYHLNLRRVHEDLWTEIDVPQDFLNWDEEACRIAPYESRCSLFRLKQGEIKNHCLAYIKATSPFTCKYRKQLPKACLPYLSGD